MISELLRQRSEEKGEPIKILLVEDNPGDAGLVQVALDESADSLLELHIEQRLAPALTLLAREKFTVVLLDLNLPDSKGFDTVTSVQEVVPRIPLVIMTGSADEVFARRAIKVGVQDYLIKDEVQPTNLVRSIFFAIERKRTENDLHALERVATAAGSSLDLESLLETILNTLMGVMGADRAAQVLEDDGQLLVKRAVGDCQGIDDPEYQQVERALISTVIQSNLPMYYELRDKGGTVKRTLLKAPLRISGETKGVVEVDWLGHHPENPRETSLLLVAAERIAGGVANAQAFEAMKTSEQQAQEERLRLRTIIDTLPVGILITDARGKGAGIQRLPGQGVGRASQAIREHR
jgi:CheY-like chemotaxis protein